MVPIYLPEACCFAVAPEARIENLLLIFEIFEARLWLKLLIISRKLVHFLIFVPCFISVCQIFSIVSHPSTKFWTKKGFKLLIAVFFRDTMRIFHFSGTRPTVIALIS